MPRLWSLNMPLSQTLKKNANTTSVWQQTRQIVRILISFYSVSFRFVISLLGKKRLSTVSWKRVITDFTHSSSIRFIMQRIIKHPLRKNKQRNNTNCFSYLWRIVSFYENITRPLRVDKPDSRVREACKCYNFSTRSHGFNSLSQFAWNLVLLKQWFLGQLPHS